MKWKMIGPFMLGTMLLISGCSGSAVQNSSDNGGATEETSADRDGSSATVIDPAEMFTDRDMEIGYDEETSAHIVLSGDTASCDSDAVQISGSMVTITEEGTYILSGTLLDGMIVVNAEETDKIQLVLSGVDITNETSAALYIPEADKVFITTASGTENILSNGGTYEAIDENNIDSVIFSKSDLTLNGAGTLQISAAAGHGIVSKDDLVLTGGTYVISVASHGLSGKDSVRIADGSYTITSGKDGIHAENADDTSLGFVYVADGEFDITAQGDGISSGSSLLMEDGSCTIVTGDGSQSVTMTDGADEFRQSGEESAESSDTEEGDTVSQKGMKSDGSMTISAGTIVTDTADDSIHSNGDIVISSGTFELQSGDDAVHSDGTLTIQDGTFQIAYCYEGLEGQAVIIDAGVFSITSYDDGINAAGGTDGSGFGGARPGQDGFSSDSDNYITVNGGEFTIVSGGDCVDSNGDLTINGGTMDLTCNGNGDTALDCDGTYTNNGGSVSTNDGSENNSGQMGGGKMRDGQPGEAPDGMERPDVMGGTPGEGRQQNAGEDGI